jgi:hypothetical protein
MPELKVTINIVFHNITTPPSLRFSLWGDHLAAAAPVSASGGKPAGRGIGINGKQPCGLPHSLLADMLAGISKPQGDCR